MTLISRGADSQLIQYGVWLRFSPFCFARAKTSLRVWSVCAHSSTSRSHTPAADMARPDYVDFIDLDAQLDDDDSEQDSARPQRMQKGTALSGSPTAKRAYVGCGLFRCCSAQGELMPEQPAPFFAQASPTDEPEVNFGEDLTKLARLSRAAAQALVAPARLPPRQHAAGLRLHCGAIDVQSLTDGEASLLAEALKELPVAEVSIHIPAGEDSMRETSRSMGKLRPEAAQALCAAAVAARACNRLRLCGLPNATSLDSKDSPNIEAMFIKPLQNRGALCGMQILALERCCLVGSFPQEIGHCVNLLELNIARNQISGCLPAVLGACVCLQTLTAESNQLCGCIPPALGQCTQLRKLHLNDNRLCYGIPVELGACTSLQSLHLHANRLTGYARLRREH